MSLKLSTAIGQPLYIDHPDGTRTTIKRHAKGRLEIDAPAEVKITRGERTDRDRMEAAWRAREEARR